MDHTPLLSDGAAPMINRRQIIGRLKAVGREPELGPNTRTVGAHDYTDTAHFAAERQKLFREYPIFVCHASHLANRGDYKAVEIAGVPLLFLRGKDGVLRGFRNACRHRGAPLAAEGCGHGMRKIVCPYHGWAYNDHGGLATITLKQAFPDLDYDEKGLRQVHVVEEGGLVFTVIDNPPGTSHLGSHLAGLAAEFDEMGLGGLVFYKEDSITTPINWKLAYETFGESYHLPTLHPSLASVIVGSGLAYDAYGPNGRNSLPLAGLRNLPDDDEEGWADAVSGNHFLLHYLVFPNLIVTVMDGAASLTVISPGRDVGETITTQIQLYAPTLDPELVRNYEGFFDANLHVLTATEDYPMVIGIFKSLNAGSIDAVTLGRAEWPLHVFHDFRQVLMGGDTDAK